MITSFKIIKFTLVKTVTTEFIPLPIPCLPSRSKMFSGITYAHCFSTLKFAVYKCNSLGNPFEYKECVCVMQMNNFFGFNRL